MQYYASFHSCFLCYITGGKPVVYLFIQHLLIQSISILKVDSVDRSRMHTDVQQTIVSYGESLKFAPVPYRVDGSQTSISLVVSDRRPHLNLGLLCDVSNIDIVSRRLCTPHDPLSLSTYSNFNVRYIVFYERAWNGEYYITANRWPTDQLNVQKQINHATSSSVS